jgi:signal peptidase I
VISRTGAVDESSARHKKRPLVAALLSILIPGLGHIYTGQARRALLMFILFVAAWGSMLLVMLFLEIAPANVIIGALLFLGPCIFIMADAYRSARVIGGVSVRPWYQRWYGLTGIIVLFGLVAPSLAGLVKTSFVEAFRLPTDSMAPTILAGDYILVRKTVPDLAAGSIVVFPSPAEPSTFLIKRIIGRPGDTLEMRNKQLRVNHRRMTEPYIQHVDRDNDLYSPAMYWQTTALADRGDSARYQPTRDNWGPLVVPPGHLFMLGDNRDDTEDSRYWGFVPVTDIIGYPKRIYFSIRNGVRWDRIGQSLAPEHRVYAARPE